MTITKKIFLVGKINTNILLLIYENTIYYLIL